MSGGTLVYHRQRVCTSRGEKGSGRYLFHVKLNLADLFRTIPGGRIIDNLQIDNLQIDNRQIDNLQIDNQNLQIDNQKIVFFLHNSKLITNKL